MIKKNIFDIRSIENFQDEIFENILSHPGEICKIERIISKGQSSPSDFFFDQDNDELVFLLQGTSKIQFQDEPEVNLKSGDYLIIEKHKKHRVSYTSTNPECIWLAIHYK